MHSQPPAVDGAHAWAAEDRLRLAAETAGLGLWTWDVATSAVEWSPECYAIHGMQPGTFEGSKEAFFELVHPHDRGRTQAEVQAAIEQRRRYESEFRIVCPDGTIRWVANTGVARYDPQGRCTSVLGTIQDITARRATETALQVALEASGTGTFRWSIQTDALWWDTALDRLFGLEPGQVVRGLEEFIARVHPEDRAEVIERCNRCKLHGEDFEMEFRVVHPDGSIHWLYDRGRTFLDAAGRPQTMTGACVDITERKQAESALRASEVFYRQTLESVPGLTFTTREDGFCDYLSDQWSTFTGIPAHEHLGRDWVQALHPDDRDRAREAFESAVAAKSNYTVEYRMRRHDGQYEWFKAQGHFIPGHGALPARWIGTVVNVHDLKETEAALRARERELRTLTESSPDVIVRFDRDLRHVFVSAAIERITGLPPSIFIGRTNRDLGMPPALCDQWEAEIRRVFDEGSPGVSHFDMPTGGETRHFISSLVPEFGAHGQVEFALCITRDSTEAWRAQEALRRADRQKDDFLATLAHELRNPLAPLRTGLAVLQRSGSTPEQAHVQGIMERQLDHMVRLVDELLDVARISQGKVVLRRELLPLDAVLNQAVEAARPWLETHSHALIWDGADPDWHINADATRLVQVVGNLLNNAAKYTPARGVVTLKAALEGKELRISVEDTGVGLPPELLERVFERFVQVDQHLERAQGGLGIGLSVVKSLVEMHGGRVAAHSGGPGTGSRFSIWLPRAHKATRNAIHVRPSGAASGPTVQRVLIVDDNEDAAETLAMVLELQGHQTRRACDGPSGLREAEAWRPDIVFLDIGMPGMSGYEVASRLRALPGWQHTLLVALTGWGTEQDRARSVAAGFDVHLTKPVDLLAVEALLTGVSGQAPGLPSSRSGNQLRA